MAKKDKDQESKYYSKIIIYKGMKASFIPVFIVLLFVVAGLVFKANIQEESWTTLIAPVLGIGALICIFPLTEEWQYTPWQAKAQKYEREFKD